MYDRDAGAARCGGQRGRHTSGGVAFFHPEHNHWHQSAVAAFTLKAGNPFAGLTVATGVKITFCFVDVKTYSSTGNEKKTYPRTYFERNGDFQGLAAHWADEYHQSTPLQELEVTGPLDPLRAVLNGSQDGQMSEEFTDMIVCRQG